MNNILKNQHNMNIIGQGGKIILFMLPSLVFAIWLHLTNPEASTLPETLKFLTYIGWIWLVPGIGLWATGVIQLLINFPKGKLITDCAYGIVRNPIYSSVTFFILPAVSLITLTWVYSVPAFFLYLGVIIFIKKEEEQLRKTFGKQYEDYISKVNRIIPIKKS